MYRVELKEILFCKVINLFCWFLMYRVELKALDHIQKLTGFCCS